MGQAGAGPADGGLDGPVADGENRGIAKSCPRPPPPHPSIHYDDLCYDQEMPDPDGHSSSLLASPFPQPGS